MHIKTVVPRKHQQNLTNASKLNCSLKQQPVGHHCCWDMKSVNAVLGQILLTFWRRNYFFKFSTSCIQNVNNTVTKQVRIMKQTAFWREKNGEYTPVYKMWIIQEPNKLELWNKLHFEEKKNGEYTPCLKYSVPVFV